MILVENINPYKKKTELINLSSDCPQSETNKIYDFFGSLNYLTTW